MLREYATDRDVYDLGAGDGVLTRNVARYAKTVVAVDTESPKTKATANILYIAANFEQFASTCMMQKHGADAVALLSWPANNASAMRTVLPLLECVPTVIYIGCSTDGTSCGAPDLFRYFLGRTLLEEVPCRRNTMLVLGAPCSPRAPTREETAGIDDTRIYPF